jgi:hypothetical protein
MADDRWPMAFELIVDRHLKMTVNRWAMAVFFAALPEVII